MKQIKTLLSFILLIFSILCCTKNHNQSNKALRNQTDTLISVKGDTSNLNNFRKITTGNWIDLSYVPISESGEELSFNCIEALPVFPGGFDSLASYYNRNLKYPETAINDNIQGKVIVSFIINKKGEVTSVKLIKSIRHDLDSSCITTIKKLPNWKPGTMENKTISIKLCQPIRFKLEE